jgi:hypothetical protein
MAEDGFSQYWVMQSCDFLEAVPVASTHQSKGQPTLAFAA